MALCEGTADWLGSRGPGYPVCIKLNTHIRVEAQNPNVLMMKQKRKGPIDRPKEGRR
jgi:hypothetical protein